MQQIKPAHLLLITLLALGLSQCGQKGGLTRPEQGASFSIAP